VATKEANLEVNAKNPNYKTFTSRQQNAGQNHDTKIVSFF